VRLLLSALMLAVAAGGCSRSEVDAAPALTKVDVTLPSEEAFFEGPQADTLNTNCTACHSAEMVLYQPSLSAAQWASVVKKMREVYKAPIAEEDDADIVAALVALRRE
jgi:cytochrome c5